MSGVGQHFECPLAGAHFDVAGPPYPSAQETLQAIARYQASEPGPARGQIACEIYLRHLSLVRKTLSRFCPRGECLPGRCLNEDLVGESFPTFLKALDGFDGSRGVDFLGYLSQRLTWGIDHVARRELRRRSREGNADGIERIASGVGGEGERLASIFVDELLERITPEESWLVVQYYAVGRPTEELAESLGVSPAAVRKRLERLRRRLRAFASGDSEAESSAP